MDTAISRNNEAQLSGPIIAGNSTDPEIQQKPQDYPENKTSKGSSKAQRYSSSMRKRSQQQSDSSTYKRKSQDKTTIVKNQSSTHNRSQKQSESPRYKRMLENKLKKVKKNKVDSSYGKVCHDHSQQQSNEPSSSNYNKNQEQPNPSTSKTKPQHQLEKDKITTSAGPSHAKPAQPANVPKCSTTVGTEVTDLVSEIMAQMDKAMSTRRSRPKVPKYCEGKRYPSPSEYRNSKLIASAPRGLVLHSPFGFIRQVASADCIHIGQLTWENSGDRWWVNVPDPQLVVLCQNVRSILCSHDQQPGFIHVGDQRFVHISDPRIHQNRGQKWFFDETNKWLPIPNYPRCFYICNGKTNYFSWE